MQVWQLLDVFELNLEAGELVKGALVTVGGEKAGQKRAPGAFWNQDCLEKRARRGRYKDDCNIVEDAVERQGLARRSLLRHRVFIKQCHAIRSTTGKHRFDLILVTCC